MPVKIQLRRDTSSNWSTRNPVLFLGEPGFETDTNKLKLGDGTSTWNDLGYLTPDFINIVSSGGIANLTVPQQNDIVEGTIVLTTDGSRWVYIGSGDKTLEASYIELADISPAWIQITSKPASLVGLAELLTTASGDFILASGNNVYQVVNFAESVDDRVGSLVVAGTGINVTYNDGANSLTVSTSGLINNPANNRLLSSRDSSTTGIDAESNLTWDGNKLSISPASGVVSSAYINTNYIRKIGDNTTLDVEYDYSIDIKATDNNGAIYLRVGTSASTVQATLDSTGLTVNSDVTANKLVIDNITIDGNTISSTNANGNLILAPNGTGDVQADADTLRVGDSNSNATVTTNGTGDLILNTNSGTNSGSITIEDGANNDITISPNGSGQIILGKQNSASDPQELSFANGNFSLDGDARFSSYVLKRTTSSSGWNSLYLDYPTNSDDTITIDDTTATFSIHIGGRASNGDSAGFVIRGCVKKYSSTVSLVGSPIIESFLNSNFATANAQISTSSSGLVIQVDQGSSGVSGTVYWVASVQISRVKV